MQDENRNIKMLINNVNGGNIARAQELINQSSPSEKRLLLATLSIIANKNAPLQPHVKTWIKRALTKEELLIGYDEGVKERSIEAVVNFGLSLYHVVIFSSIPDDYSHLCDRQIHCELFCREEVEDSLAPYLKNWGFKRNGHGGYINTDESNIFGIIPKVRQHLPACDLVPYFTGQIPS